MKKTGGEGWRRLDACALIQLPPRIRPLLRGFYTLHTVPRRWKSRCTVLSRTTRDHSKAKAPCGTSCVLGDDSLVICPCDQGKPIIICNGYTQSDEHYHALNDAPIRRLIGKNGSAMEKSTHSSKPDDAFVLTTLRLVAARREYQSGMYHARLMRVISEVRASE